MELLAGNNNKELYARFVLTLQKHREKRDFDQNYFRVGRTFSFLYSPGVDAQIFVHIFVIVRLVVECDFIKTIKCLVLNNAASQSRQGGNEIFLDG